MHDNCEPCLGIIYDNREILNPLFQTLQANSINYEKIDPYDVEFPLFSPPVTFSLLYNDLSSPGYHYRTQSAFRATIEYLRVYEHHYGNAAASRVINGTLATETLFSKARQLALFLEQGLSIPKSIITTARNIPAAIGRLRFPVVVKEVFNHSESIFFIFENEQDLAEQFTNNLFASDESLTVVMQEYVALKNDVIFHTDVINGEAVNTTRTLVFKHADYIRPFNIAPEIVSIPPGVTDAIRQIARASSLDVSSFQYGHDQRTNELIFLGIYPPSISFETKSESGYLLSDLTAKYIERRLNKVREIKLAIS